MEIKDQSNTDLVNLRRTIYLTIQSAMDPEEAVHKLMKINLPAGQEPELPSMIVECCSQEKTYTKFFGLIGERSPRSTGYGRTYSSRVSPSTTKRSTATRQTSCGISPGSLGTCSARTLSAGMRFRSSTSTRRRRPRRRVFLSRSSSRRSVKS